MQEAGAFLAARSDQLRKRLAGAGPGGDVAEAELARELGGGVADGIERMLQGFAALRMRFERAERVPAGDDERVHAVELERNVWQKLDAQQRREQRLMPELHEPLGLTLGIWFGPGDEDAHRSRLGEACQKVRAGARNEIAPGL